MVQETIKVTTVQGQVIRQLALDVSAAAGRRIPIGAVIMSACIAARDRLIEDASRENIASATERAEP